MRVLWFTDWQPPAVRRHLGLAPHPGPQAWVDRLAEMLAGQPVIELAIATPGAARFAPFEDDGIRYVDVPVHTPASRLARIAANWRHRLTPAAALAAAAGVVRDLRPDVVHVHGTEGAWGLLAPTMAPTPCVISLQGILQAYERLYFAGRSPGRGGAPGGEQRVREGAGPGAPLPASCAARLSAKRASCAAPAGSSAAPGWDRACWPT